VCGFFRRKSRTIKVSQREAELIAQAEAEAKGSTPADSSGDDNMPPTVMKMSISKPNGRGFRNITVQGNGYETNFIDSVNKRYEENERIAEQKRD